MSVRIIVQFLCFLIVRITYKSTPPEHRRRMENLESNLGESSFLSPNVTHSGYQYHGRMALHSMSHIHFLE